MGGGRRLYRVPVVEKQQVVARFRREDNAPPDHALPFTRRACRARNDRNDQFNTLTTSYQTRTAKHNSGKRHTETLAACRCAPTSAASDDLLGLHIHCAFPAGVADRYNQRKPHALH